MVRLRKYIRIAMIICNMIIIYICTRSCDIVEIVDQPVVQSHSAPIIKAPCDSVVNQETIRIPIGFEVKVEEWEDINTTL